MDIKKKAIISFLVVILLVIIFTVGFLIGRLNPGLFGDLPNEATDNLPINTDEVFKAITNIEDIDPWKNIDKEFKEAESAKPTVAELDAIYRKVHTAMTDRDYSGFKALSSSYRVWHIDNNKVFKYVYDGLPYLETINQSGEDNFKNNAPLMNNHFDAPDLSMITAASLGEIKKTDIMIANIVNPELTKITNVIGGPWDSIKLTYNIAKNNYHNGTGSVSFLYEDGKWRYDFEIWEHNYSSNQEIGDKPSKDAVVFYYDFANINEFPKVITINSGEYLAWQNATGVIFTVDTSSKSWNSPFLKNANYTKQFLAKGSFTYVIRTPFDEVFRGTINVI